MMRNQNYVDSRHVNVLLNPLNALLLHPGNHGLFEDKLISLFVIWAEEEGDYLPSSKAIINPVYSLRAFPLLTIILYSSAALSLFSSLVPLTHHRFFLTCVSSTVTLPCKRLIQACTLSHVYQFFSTHMY